MEYIVRRYVMYGRMKGDLMKELDEISKASGISRMDIGKTYRYVARKLGIRILPAKSQDYVPRFGSLLGLSANPTSQNHPFRL